MNLEGFVISTVGKEAMKHELVLNLIFLELSSLKLPVLILERKSMSKCCLVFLCYLIFQGFSVHRDVVELADGQWFEIVHVFLDDLLDCLPGATAVVTNHDLAALGQFDFEDGVPVVLDHHDKPLQHKRSSVLSDLRHWEVPYDKSKEGCEVYEPPQWHLFPMFITRDSESRYFGDKVIVVVVAELAHYVLYYC